MKLTSVKLSSILNYYGENTVQIGWSNYKYCNYLEVITSKLSWIDNSYFIKILNDVSSIRNCWKLNLISHLRIDHHSDLLINDFSSLNYFQFPSVPVKTFKSIEDW